MVSMSNKREMTLRDVLDILHSRLQGLSDEEQLEEARTRAETLRVFPHLAALDPISILYWAYGDTKAYRAESRIKAMMYNEAPEPETDAPTPSTAPERPVEASAVPQVSVFTPVVEQRATATAGMAVDPRSIDLGATDDPVPVAPGQVDLGATDDEPTDPADGDTEVVSGDVQLTDEELDQLLGQVHESGQPEELPEKPSDDKP